MPLDLSAWPGLVLGERNRPDTRDSEWVGELSGMKVGVARLRRSLGSLEWEFELYRYLLDREFVVCQPLQTEDGQLHSDGIVVVPWRVARDPESEADWKLVAKELERLHQSTVDYPQRPECCAVTELRNLRKSVDIDLDVMPTGVSNQILAIFEDFGEVQTAVVHGSMKFGNVGISERGRVSFFGWGKSRVDIVWHDLADLGIQILDDVDHKKARTLFHAWQAANYWMLDAKYAEEQLAKLVETLDPDD